jgi:hypothetical protein
MVLAGGPGSGVFSGLQAEKSNTETIRAIIELRTMGF